MQPWKRVATIGARQHGAVTRRQIVHDAGVCGRVLTERVREQGWARPFRGVYLLPGTQPTYERDASAALLAVGGRALLTGNSSAYLLGLRPARPARVEIAIAAERGTRRRSGIVLCRHAAAALATWRQHRGLPLARPAVMFCDLARAVDDWRLAELVAAACARRLVTLDGAQRALDRLGPVAGAARLHRVLRALRGELVHSASERLGRHLLMRAGVRLHPRPYAVLERGRPLAEVDLAVPEVRYGAEIDGPHHLMPEQVSADKARDRSLGRVGWTIDRFPTELLRRAPQEFVRQVLARLATLGYHPEPAEVES